MTKAETIAYLKELHNALEKQSQLQSENRKLNNLYNTAVNVPIKTEKEINNSLTKYKINGLKEVIEIIKNILEYLIMGAIVAVVVFILFNIILGFLGPSISMEIGFVSISFSLISVIASVIVILIAIIKGILNYKNEYNDRKAEYMKKRDECLRRNEQIKNIQSNRKSINLSLNHSTESLKRQELYVNSLKSKGILHKDFCDYYCLKELISLLEHGRADTLKEAINLYLAEEREIQRDIENTAFQRQQMAMEKQRLVEAQRTAEAQERLAAAQEESASALANLNRIESWKEFEEDIGLRRKK